MLCDAIGIDVIRKNPVIALKRWLFCLACLWQKGCCAHFAIALFTPIIKTFMGHEA